MSIEYREVRAFVEWLHRRVLEDARGDALTQLTLAPSGRLWLGRLAPEVRAARSQLGERGERMEPCEVGVKLRLASGLRVLECQARMVAWRELREEGRATRWVKLAPISVGVRIDVPSVAGEVTIAGSESISSALTASGAAGLSAEVRAELEELSGSHCVVVISIVNTSPEAIPALETSLYEVSLRVHAKSAMPFQLDALPDSFRYKREVPAYGVNCGVDSPSPGTFSTSDVVRAERKRPRYWDTSLGAAPDLRFAALAEDPLRHVNAMVSTLDAWGKANWGMEPLRARAQSETWTDEMRAEAGVAAGAFWEEVARVRAGALLLGSDARLQQAFMLANESFLRSNPAYDSWRPFQLGFLLTCLPSLVDPTGAESRVVDTLWFATGGGKTETYLGLLVTAAFYDRLRGKAVGTTGWTRFPLRLLSLQQLQRFADTFAAAELVRRDEQIKGGTFSVGFLVGPATPNRISANPETYEPDFRDPEMPRRFQVLLRCPFCRRDDIVMKFDRATWSLQHWCANEDCVWNQRSLGALPFNVVDEEIYRFLPTIVVGTLDKAANLSMQAAMRGSYAAPFGRCPSGHGFTYAQRSKTPNGCLFPACAEKPEGLPQSSSLFAPTIRLQDELHLLRDSLGAIDSHYEALYDADLRASGATSKILASSATLQGYDRQVDVLYQRAGRLFPLQGPQAGHSFWSVDSNEVMRLFAAVAPRGVTTEFASDRINEALQQAVREALADPARVAQAAGVSEESVPELVCLYGVGVVYGSTIRDVEAAARSFETQIPLEPLNSVRLTGSTPFEDVRNALSALTTDCSRPFAERLHLIAASSMLSHGVDVERLNVMVMLGMPLTMAEFIQTTSRVGRTHPGLVFLIAKVARERDAGVFRSFQPLIEHAERLVDPVPITRKSRRVLEVTFAGLFMGRLYSVHEPRALSLGLKPLTTVQSVRLAFERMKVAEEAEYEALVQMLGLTSDLDQHLREDLRRMVRQTFKALNDPATSVKFLSDLLPNGGPMRSLRDVEEQVPVYMRKFQ